MSTVLQDKQSTTKEWLEERFLETTAGSAPGHPFAQFRRAAFEQLQAMAFPTRRDEDWKYTSVNRILITPFKYGTLVPISTAELAGSQIPGLETIRVVFVNGIWDPSLSDLNHLPDSCTLEPVRQAMEDQTKKEWIEIQSGYTGGTAQNAFLPMNLALGNHGIYLHIPKNEAVERPIHFIYFNTPDDQPHFSHPQIFLHAERSSAVTIIEDHRALAGAGTSLTNAGVWVDVEANANVHHYRLQQHNPESYQIHNTLVHQDRDSVYNSYVVDLGGRIIRNNLSTELDESNTETHYYGVYLADGEQQMDNQTFIDHAMPHCQSNELYKGILSDRARGVFNGKVLVRQDAQKTNAFQQNSSLVLSAGAVMDAKPQLEIYADDVRCSHGATIGHLDESAVFYLRSRGIPEPQARLLLQQAFVGEVIHNMHLESMVEYVDELIATKLNALTPVEQ
ncbi:MAG: Fe-S cluster assembly protein SufD [Saprospiraceae bacterium]|nr:Fe-S cluster assembly protein SufD [Saprospiraceae bacterium]MCB9320560.1 Fe-S cluster assembly protein SufD [Lewinellaceae bacterium]